MGLGMLFSYIRNQKFLFKRKIQESKFVLSLHSHIKLTFASVILPLVYLYGKHLAGVFREAQDDKE